MAQDYSVAKNLDTAWLNFEPGIPIIPLPDGSNHPFYVTRPDNIMQRLKRKLLRRYTNPPKYFLSGHRGCGKSTEMNRLAVDKEINKKFWPLNFSIRDHADLNDIDFKDVLLTIGGQLFLQYQERGSKKLDDQLLKELNSWQGEIEEQITTLKSGRMEGEVGAEIGGLFAKLSSKIKLEPKTRHEIRQIFERDVTKLVSVINDITAAITLNEGRPPLVLIDDLDKPDLDLARKIFIERQNILLQPSCPIVYTVSSSLFYDPAFPTVRFDPVFLPNIQMHERADRQSRHAEGYYTLKMFVQQRMMGNLITEDAIELVATMSGGVFRELTRLIRYSIDYALDAGREEIVLADVSQAATEIRNTYWRVLTEEQLQILRQVQEGQDKHNPEKLAPLLQILAVLEYNGAGTWFDIHPVLNALLHKTA
ncbi:MAG: hypothetical protein GY805_04910 [Chloroflexi bacterium]|nr:hypothetical protein [Chloroflexota bacterium]